MRTLSLIAALFAVSLSQVCDEVCTGNSSPVCGSDGLTYFNECTLRQKACLEKLTTLNVVSAGECSNVCNNADCPEGKFCVPQPKQCITTPCDQFVCLSIEEAACANTICPQSTVCVHEPKECLTTPCPQFTCQPNEICEAVCPMSFEPVCGSNFETYSNECILEAEACLTKREIRTIFKGECSEINCDIICPDSYEPVCGSNGVTYGNLCELKSQSCKLKALLTVASQGECPCNEICPESYEPVCGSDGVTYPNSCTLKSKSCLTKTPISVQYEGECCVTMCEEEYKPVCGSNGRTYGNLCSLRADSCLSKTKIDVARQVECECPRGCTKEYRPVCGSNKISYGNLCMLKLAACESGFGLDSISLDYAGECLPECPEMCPESYEPVCGSDGVTYSNECELIRESCRRKSQITKVNDGACNPECPTFCPSSYVPVCGSNGITYLNLCLLRVDACRTKTTISIENDGECATPFEGCGDMCAEIYEPVCGIDLQTYQNECTLKRENCLFRSQIDVLHKGECSRLDCPEVCTDDYNPVCGSDDVTYENICSFMAASCKNDLQLKISNMGGCPIVDPPSCDDMCPQIYDPVCGSDGTTYGNECVLSSSSCFEVLNGNPSVTLISKGECLTKDFPISWPIMLMFDLDDDLLISRTEFDNFINTFKPQATTEERDKIFSKVDMDRNNQIDESEYKFSESVIQVNSSPNSPHLFIGIGVGIVALVTVVVGALLIYKKKISPKEYSHISINSQPYSSLE